MLNKNIPLFITKIVNSGRAIILADFDHLNLTQILGTSSLAYLVTIKEFVYPEIVHYFYSNLSFHNNNIRTKVRGIDINLSLEKFARHSISPAIV